MFGFLDLAPSTLLIVMGIGYLLGSIPSGLLLTRAAGLGDVRKIGSGNIGATNVLRTGNKKLAALTLIADLLKGTLAVLLGSYWGTDAATLAGFCAFLGHLFPIWLGFKGGKGVATFLGILLALNFAVGLAACGFWLLTAVVTKYSSLSALVMAALAPLLFLINGQWAFALGVAAMVAMIFYRHQANIIRLLDRTEPRIGKRA